MESGPKGWIETATKKSVGMQKKVQILKLNQVQNFYKRQKKKKKVMYMAHLRTIYRWFYQKTEIHKRSRQSVEDFEFWAKEFRLKNLFQGFLTHQWNNLNFTSEDT